jgi:hypothetical protein
MPGRDDIVAAHSAASSTTANRQWSRHSLSISCSHPDEEAGEDALWCTLRFCSCTCASSDLDYLMFGKFVESLKSDGILTMFGSA